MRKLSLLLVFSISVCTSAYAVSGCDLNSFLNKTLHKLPLKRSKWFEKQIRSKLTDEEFYMGLNESKNILPTMENEASMILRDVQSDQEFVVNFEQKFKSVYQKSPEKNDYLRFYSKKMENYESGMQTFLHELEKVSPQKAEMFKETVEHQLKFMKSDFKKSEKLLEETGNPSLMDKIPAKISGALTELQVGLNLKGVEQVSFTLRDSPEIVKKLDEKIALIEKQISMNPEKMKVFEQQYPRVMNNFIVKNSKIENPTLQEKLKMIRAWVLDKEIDIVRKVNGKTKWVEVKSNFQAFNKVSFSTAGMGQKSYLYQINEVKDVLRFLGMEQEIGLEYFATGGVDDLLKKSLEADGVMVLQ